MSGQIENSPPTIEGPFRAIPIDALDIVLAHTTALEGRFALTATRLDGMRWQHNLFHLTVISSVCIEEDGRRWLHVSFAHPKRMPKYEEMKLVKEHFIGKDKYAIAVFPPEDMFVNLHPYCLHLWHCLDGHPLPEFSGLMKTGERSI